MTKWITYFVVVGVILLGSVSLALGEDVPYRAQFSEQLIIIGLIGGLFRLLRDAAEQEHALSMQGGEHAFGLATSHMANVAFDKYAAFCDEYLDAVHKMAGELFREGAGHKTLVAASNLVLIQQKSAAWIDSATRKNLGGFEDQLRTLGATAEFVKNAAPKDIGRGPAIKKQYELYKQILGIEPKDGPTKVEDEPIAIEEVIEKIRLLLGTEKLTSLRRKLIDRASSHYNI